MTVLDLFRGVHIAAGVLALALMWLPLFSAKGGALHRRAGRAYVIAMAGLTLAAAFVCLWRLAFDHDPGRRTFATFLLFVGVVSAGQVSAGVRVLRAKTRRAPHRHPWDLGVALVITVSGLAVFLWGILLHVPLFAGFAPVGIAIGGYQLAYWLRSPRGPMHWWFAHMVSMIGAGISTVGAFVVVNARHLRLPSDSLIVWLGPAVVGLPVMMLWLRHYQRRFRAQAAAVSPAA
jgi:uncharacterized membrane protein